MKKYKLIKEYPGSPKLDIIITDTNPVNGAQDAYFNENYGKVGVTGFILPKSTSPEKHPEFWQEVIETCGDTDGDGKCSKCLNNSNICPKQLIKDEIYYGEAFDNQKWLFRFSYINCNTLRSSTVFEYNSSMNPWYTTTGDFTINTNSSSSLKNIRKATPEEKQWLEACEKAGKFIPKEEALKSEKEWEITATISKDKSLIIKYNSSGKPIDRSWGNWLLNSTFNLNEIRKWNCNFNQWEIYSVKRLSDGVEFKVGDRVLMDNHNNHYRITKFDILGNQDIQVSGEFYDRQYSTRLYYCIKQEKLLTTEDGVDIYEGDTWYVVYLTEYADNKKRGLWKVHESNIKKTTYASHLTNRDIIRFSTKEKAEEYIAEYKPMFSVNNIRNIKTSGGYGYTSPWTIADLLKGEYLNSLKK